MSAFNISNMHIDTLQLGRRILLSRKDLSLNQEELGQKAGISRGHIAKIERGEVKNPTLEIIYRLADALGVSRAYLLGFTDDPLHEIEEPEEPNTQSIPPTITRQPSASYRTLAAELLDVFDQLSPSSQQILLAIADKLRIADDPRRLEPEPNEETD